MYTVQSTRYSCQALMQLESSGRFSKKYSNIKIRENPPSGSDMFHAVGQDSQT